MTDGHHGHPGPELAARAADPSTPQVELHRLASAHPALLPLLAENPNTYQDLLDWMAGLGDPEVDAALARRSAAESTQSLSPEVDQPTVSFGDRKSSHQPTEASPGAADAATTPFPTQQPEEFTGGPAYGTEGHGAPAEPVPHEAEGLPEAAHPVAPQQPAQPRQSAGHMQPAHYAHQWQGPTGTDQSGTDQFFGQEPETQERRGGKAVLIGLIAVLALGALAASVFLFLGSPFGGDDAQTTAEQQPAPAEEEQDQQEEADQPAEEESPSPEATPSPTDEEEDDENDEELERPAPEDALELASFSTPSGNIHCELTGDEALCTVGWHEFDAPDGCEGGTTLRVTEDGAEEACGSSVDTQPVSLDYEASATNGDFACESTEEGVECWSTLTGEGFLIAAAEYDLFS